MWHGRTQAPVAPGASLMTPTAQGGLLRWRARFQQGRSTTATELWHRWKVLGPKTKSFLRKAACEESLGGRAGRSWPAGVSREALAHGGARGRHRDPRIAPFEPAHHSTRSGAFIVITMQTITSSLDSGACSSRRSCGASRCPGAPQKPPLGAEEPPRGGRGAGRSGVASPPPWLLAPGGGLAGLAAVEDLGAVGQQRGASLARLLEAPRVRDAEAPPGSAASPGPSPSRRPRGLPAAEGGRRSLPRAGGGGGRLRGGGGRRFLVLLLAAGQRLPPVPRRAAALRGGGGGGGRGAVRHLGAAPAEGGRASGR